MLSRKGRRYLAKLRRGGSQGQVSDEAVLALELIERIGGAFIREDASYMIAELVLRYGSAAAALDALRAGQVGLEKTN
jgi:hypothetical protein